METGEVLTADEVAERMAERGVAVRTADALWRAEWRSVPSGTLGPVAAVVLERAHQDEKWGTVADNYVGRAPADWSLILGEEVGEVARAILEREGRAALRAELAQVAAVAVAWMVGQDRGGPDA